MRAYLIMMRARKTDERAVLLYKQNKCLFQIGCAGHEAVQVATSFSINPELDWSYPYYRDMAYCMGLGLTSKEILLSCLSKKDGPSSGGRQMPMHYGKKDLNIVSQSSPTGTQFLQAVGAAIALKHSDSNGVVYVSCGEGTTSQGSYHEALNWSAREKLPIIFLVQNNKYAISVHISEQLAGGSVFNISSGYENLDVHKVDGLDFMKSFDVTSAAIKRARNGEGPSVICADVVRLQSHSISDNHYKYRTPIDIDSDKEKDPLEILESKLIDLNISSSEELAQLKNNILKEVAQESEWAELQDDPDPSTYLDHVYSLPDLSLSYEESDEDLGEEAYMVDALNYALEEEMSTHPRMMIFGQDVAKGKGGVFSVTRGLTEKFGEGRVFNSPLAEASICGVSIGLSTLGYLPVAEIQFGDYIWTGMMQIRNELAMLNYRSEGAFSCPAVIRIAVGGYIRGALYHSQNIEATFSHFPGIYIVMPSNARDAKGLLKSAIRSPNPVLFLEHKGLYRQPFAKASIGGFNDLTPIGKARIVKEGSEATIITWGMSVHHSLRVAKDLDVEVLDIRSMVPLDIETILTSISKTSRVLVVHEDAKFMGFGAEIVAIINEIGFHFLDAPVMRVAGANSPVPMAPQLEDKVLPQVEDIKNKLDELLAY